MDSGLSPRPAISYSVEVMRCSPQPDGAIRIDETAPVNVWRAPGVDFQVTVPAGFVSDGASIPRFLWPVLGPPVGAPHFVPAVVHDFLCSRAVTYGQRVLADAVFFLLLKQHGVSDLKRAALFVGVRFYGRFVWRAGRRDA